MTNLPPSAVPHSAISGGERERRAYAVNFGRGSVRYEGGILTQEAEEINARFINGELSLDEFVAAVLASDTVARD